MTTAAEPCTGWGQPESEAIRDGEELRAARKAKGYTQADLGRLCGVSGSLVGQMERASYPITVTFRRSARTWLGVELGRCGDES